MSGNKGRVLTIRVVIEDPEKAQWIWDDHKKKDEYTSGVRVCAIANGDIFAESEKYHDCLCRMIEEFSGDYSGFCDDIQDEMEEFEKEQVRLEDDRRAAARKEVECVS